MSKITKNLYSASRKGYKYASVSDDINKLSKGDISGLAKKRIRKKMYKTSNSILRSIFKKLNLK